MAKKYLALDLGAESGRGIVGEFNGKKIKLDVMHRFKNGPVMTNGTLYWDVLYLFNEMKTAMRAAANKHGKSITAMGIDTWGVDFGLLDKKGKLLSNPVNYRDKRTRGMFKETFKRVSRERVYEQTGIQFMEINTLYQVLSLVLSRSPQLKAAETFLTVPDLFNYFFTGKKVCEFSNATTTQMYDPKKGSWSFELMSKLGIPKKIFPKIVRPGTRVGNLLKEICEDTGMQSVPVIAPACHDTGSAVAAIPVTGDEEWAYLSSGTWSLMGIELQKPLINADALKYNFTNEGGVFGTFRFLKNIMGLWILQETRRTWMKEDDRDISYNEIVAIARKAKCPEAFIDPNYAEFLSPGNMPAKINGYLKKTKQAGLKSRGEMVNCILVSLALEYRRTVDGLNAISKGRIKKLHVVGGGTQNELLCRFTANATRVPVITGPVEATALGNVMMQAIAMGDISTLKEGRKIIGSSIDLKVYPPEDRGIWEDSYGRYLKVLGKL